MKTITKLSTLLLFCIICLGVQAQKISSEKQGIDRSKITQMKKYKGEKPSSKEDKKDTENASNERIAYDAFGNAIWVPNSSGSGYSSNYGNPYGNSSCNVNSSPYGSCNTSCAPSTSPYNNTNYGYSGWYTPFTTNYGWNNYNGGFQTFYDEFNQPYDWNVTTGDYGLEIPKVGLWLEHIYGLKHHVSGIVGQAIYMHEDGFFYRGWRSQDERHNFGKYQVVLPAPGATVTRLPRVARKVYQNGQEYFIANNIVFLQKSQRRFTVVGVLG